MSSRGEPGELPAVDDHIVVSESGYEIDDGKLVVVPPALEPHAALHSKLAALLEAHVADEFRTAVDMLIRTSEDTDIAPDAAVYPRARDPRTGGRQIEHLAFEVMNTQSLVEVGRRADKLVTRGVRRVFAIDVIRARVFEWMPDPGTWSQLDPASAIEDEVFAVALPVDALVSAVKADDAMARALLAKHNPVLETALQHAREEGHEQARAALVHAIVVALEGRGAEVSPDARERIAGERDVATLARWLARAETCERADQIWD